MAQAVSNSITRRNVIAGLALTAAPVALAGADNAYAHRLDCAGGRRAGAAGLFAALLAPGQRDLTNGFGALTGKIEVTDA